MVEHCSSVACLATLCNLQVINACDYPQEVQPAGQTVQLTGQVLVVQVEAAVQSSWIVQCSSMVNMIIPSQDTVGFGLFTTRQPIGHRGRLFTGHD